MRILHLEDFLFETGGRLALSFWELFFPEESQNQKPNDPLPFFCYCSEINGRIYVNDIHGNPIMDISTTKAEMQTLLSYVNKFFYEYEHIDDCMEVPWLEIAQRAHDLMNMDNQLEAKDISQMDLNAGNPNKIDSSPIQDVMHNIKAGYQWIEESKFYAKPVPLCHSLWFEKEICLLFADSNIGKSILATQIALDLAKSRKVVYFDYELSADVFLDRFGEYFNKFPSTKDNFIRCQPKPDIFLCDNAVDHILADINAIIYKHCASVVVIDNLSFIKANVKNNESSAKLMFHLKKIASDNCISMLVIAHSAKRNPAKPITQNDIAGSKAIFNFADSAFSIGQSLIDPNVQYIKQLKSRSSQISFGSNRVILVNRVNSDGYLHFENMGFDKEQNLIYNPSSSGFSNLKNVILALEKEGLSQAKIAEILHISQPSVSRIKNS